MTESSNESPKAFVSYSWTSPEHEAWVLELATELEESGVHVIIDKWDLREGADKYAFMEKMVTDSTVRKVVLVCDRLYAEKADGRKGGVGTETQIVSQEVYEQVDLTDQEQKFVALTTEKDEDGNPYVPTFLKSRIYIDISESDKRADNFEQLLRWIYDKPIYKRPDRGKPPAYLSAEDKMNLGTSSRFRQAIEAVRQDKPSAIGAVRDYFDTFAENLVVFRIEEEDGKEFDDQVVESIEKFLPYRDETIDLFLAIASYRSDPEIFDSVHQFFERILPYGFRPAGHSSWKEWSADNFKFVLHELFLYAVATLLKNNKFEQVNLLVQQGYYFPPGSPDIREPGLMPFTFFRGYLRSLEQHRNQRLGLRRLSVTADLMQQRAERSDLTFEDVMQADFFLFLRDELGSWEGSRAYRSWFPVTLVYTSYHHYPFEIFARAESQTYFDELKIAINVTSKNQLLELLQKYRSGDRRLPHWDFDSFDPAILMGIEKLATRP